MGYSRYLTNNVEIIQIGSDYIVNEKGFDSEVQPLPYRDAMTKQLSHLSWFASD